MFFHQKQSLYNNKKSIYSSLFVKFNLFTLSTSSYKNTPPITTHNFLPPIKYTETTYIPPIDSELNL